MTPTERARLIDKQEFEVESKALLERALRYAEQCRKREQQRMAVILGRKGATPAGNFNHGNGRTARVYAHNGKELTIEQWAVEFGMSPLTLRNRLAKGSTIAEALAPLKRGQKVTIAGRTLTRSQWADFLGISYTNLYQRIRKHGSLEAAVNHHMEMERRPKP